MLGRIGGDDAAGLFSHGGQFLAVRDDAFQDICRGVCVVRIENPTIFWMDEFRMAAIVYGGCHRQAARHAFWNDKAPVILQRWNDEAVSCPIEDRNRITLSSRVRLMTDCSSPLNLAYSLWMNRILMVECDLQAL